MGLQCLVIGSAIFMCLTLIIGNNILFRRAHTGNQQHDFDEQVEDECNVEIPELEPEWVRHFAEAPWETPSCGSTVQLAHLEEVGHGKVRLVEIPGSCEGTLLLSFVDPATSNWTAVRIQGHRELLTDSAILQCVKTNRQHPDAPTQFILHPRVDPALHATAQASEENFRRWRSSLPENERSSIPPLRPNILFVMVDSMSAAQLERGLPQTMKLLSELDGRESRPQAFAFSRFNVISSGTHNNVPGFLAGLKCVLFPACPSERERLCASCDQKRDCGRTAPEQVR